MDTVSEGLLKGLGSGESISSLCRTHGMTKEEFDRWWNDEIKRRAPEPEVRLHTGVSSEARVERNRWGVPKILADNDEDLFFGIGYAMAQDRLFQLDYLRRKGHGRLSEILGGEGIQLDTIARTVGLNRIATAEWKSIPAETKTLLQRFSEGVNALIEQSSAYLPVEFALLDYEPEPWQPVDCLAIAAEFRYYLTVRFPVIVGPELAKQALGDGSLYRVFLTGEADEESIIPADAYTSATHGLSPVGASVGDPQEGEGSNNWVVGGAHTVSGLPMVASDPHIAFAAVSCWYEVQLKGGSFDVAGMAYTGMPAVMFGRNRDVAWGITNNICSQRDLYQERTDPSRPGFFLYDGEWEPERTVVEAIRVRGFDQIHKTVRFSRNGPIVDEILPAEAAGTGPVSLRWLGHTNCGWLTSLLGMDRAGSVAELREATRGWMVPTWSLVIADRDGHFGYQAVGGIPVRAGEERGFRPGWDPAHQWQGLIPFEQMPRLEDPERGWIATANNRVAPDDFPYPLSGRWASGHRARRIRQMIEERDGFSKETFAAMQRDTRTLRAEEALPGLLPVLLASEDNRVLEAAGYLQKWDRNMAPDSVAALVFEVFFDIWCRRVTAERFDVQLAASLAGSCGGLAGRLIHEDSEGWFEGEDRETAIVGALRAALSEIEDRLGTDMSEWAWGHLHKIQLRHVLSGRGDLGVLLDRGGLPVGGNGVTVCNTGFDPNWAAPMGANYRLISDLGEDGMWAVESQGQSGHPGSDHYCDQLVEWLEGRYHFLGFESDGSQEEIESIAELLPEVQQGN